MSIYGRDSRYTRPTRYRREFNFFWLPVAFFIIAIIGVPAHILTWGNTRETVTITVEDKDRTSNSEGGSDSRIYTDKGVFAVGDDWLKGEFNSSDTYADLVVGGTYEVDTVGWRNGFLSMFPNIVEVRDADTNE